MISFRIHPQSFDVKDNIEVVFSEVRSKVKEVTNTRSSATTFLMNDIKLGSSDVFMEVDRLTGELLGELSAEPNVYVTEPDLAFLFLLAKSLNTRIIFVNEQGEEVSTNDDGEILSFIESQHLDRNLFKSIAEQVGLFELPTDFTLQGSLQSAYF